MHANPSRVAQALSLIDQLVITNMRKRPSHSLRGRSASVKAQPAAQATGSKRAAPIAPSGSSIFIKRSRLDSRGRKGDAAARSTDVALPERDQSILQAVRPSA